MLQRDPFLLTNYISCFMVYVVLNFKRNNSLKLVPLKAVYSLKELAEYLCLRRGQFRTTFPRLPSRFVVLSKLTSLKSLGLSGQAFS